MRSVLQGPLCYEAGGKPTGTLKDLSGWCAARRPGVKLHFAKTGTQVTEDVNATVDAWITGGLQFANGAAYSYVVVVGTGSAREPWARNLHAAQVAVPLLDALLTDLEAEATGRKLPAKAKTPAAAAAAQRAGETHGQCARALTFGLRPSTIIFPRGRPVLRAHQPARWPLSSELENSQRLVLEVAGPELLFCQAQHDGCQFRPCRFFRGFVGPHIALCNGGPSLIVNRPQQGQNFGFERLGTGCAHQLCSYWFASP